MAEDREGTMKDGDYEEVHVAADGSEIWRNGVRYVPAVDPEPYSPALVDPDPCQHRQIDNDTWQCEACGEQMTGQSSIPQWVKSAPNAAAGICANGPDCDGGEGCTAVYIPDRTREVDVLIDVEVTYTCARCHNDGTVMSAGEPIQWDCGHSHHGARIPAAEWTRQ